MKYLIIGAGGTGGGIGGFLAKAGKDVTLIARGEHLACIKEHGLQLETVDGSFCVPVPACTMEEYAETPDIIFVCVKGYSLDSVIPFLQRVAAPHTVVIPILNLYGTGGKLQRKLPSIPITDGCIYIAAQIQKPGTILMSGKIFRVVFGLRRDTPRETADALCPVLKKVEQDLSDAEILPIFSSQIERDALQKFSFVSPMAAMGAYYDIPAAPIQQAGSMRDTFRALVEEIKTLSKAMGIGLPDNIAEINLAIMDDLSPTATASMHRDIRAGRDSEVDGLVYEVVRLGREYGVKLPLYEELAQGLRKKLSQKS